MRKIKVLFTGIGAMLLLVIIAISPVLLSKWNDSRILAQVIVEKINEKDILSMHTSKLSTEEKIKLLYDYNSEIQNYVCIKQLIKSKEDYNKIRENIADTDSQKHELDVIISILEKRVPHYEYHLGDTVYIGADKYEIAGIKDNVVTLIDTKFPILNKTMSFDEFERKVKDNYSNDHLIVKEQEENTIEVNSYKEQTLEQDLYDFYNTYDIYDLNEVPIEQIRDDLKNSESIQQTIQYLKEILKQEDEVNDFVVPPIVQLFVLLPIPRLQSLIRYSLQVMVDVFADTFCAWLQSTFSL